MMGMPPATAASKFKATPFFSASRASSVPCLGKQRLVGGDHVLAGPQGRFHSRLGGSILAADQLDEHVDGRIGRQPLGFVEPGDIIEGSFALLVARAGADTSHHDVAADHIGEARPVGLQQAKQATANGAEPGNTQSQWLAHRA